MKRVVADARAGSSAEFPAQSDVSDPLLDDEMHPLRRRLLIPGLLVGVAILVLVFARIVLGSKPLYETENGAIDGYDPVAYFTQEEAVRGSDAFMLEWKGASWRFSSEIHREAFASNPGKYVPQYGGYCAYGMSEGYLVEVDPNAWTVVEGRLYLNLDQSIMESWRRTKDRRIPQADKHWERQ